MEMVFNGEFAKFWQMADVSGFDLVSKDFSSSLEVFGKNVY